MLSVYPVYTSEESLGTLALCLLTSGPRLIDPKYFSTRGITWLEVTSPEIVKIALFGPYHLKKKFSKII